MAFDYPAFWQVVFFAISHIHRDIAAWFTSSFALEFYKRPNTACTGPVRVLTDTFPITAVPTADSASEYLDNGAPDEYAHFF